MNNGVEQSRQPATGGRNRGGIAYEGVDHPLILTDIRTLIETYRESRPGPRPCRRPERNGTPAPMTAGRRAGDLAVVQRQSAAGKRREFP